LLFEGNSFLFAVYRLKTFDTNLQAVDDLKTALGFNVYTSSGIWSAVCGAIPNQLRDPLGMNSHILHNSVICINRSCLAYRQMMMNLKEEAQSPVNSVFFSVTLHQHDRAAQNIVMACLG
jgi:hypothetical protein